ncbi:hypothetical protein [Sphingomonas sp.]|jgi:hypothetical protein|uniref:hypothetical protein n=1 Tax=Sphingomonas sp. TaxID=28214 RepID=UPI002EDAB671
MLNTPFSPAALLLFLVAPGAGTQAPDWERAIELFQQHITVHVPRVTMTTTIIMRSPVPVPMVEKKAEDCVKIERITGFSVNRTDSVDLLLNDGKLLRAKLGDDCPALGFYSGFYVKPTADKKICAGRDAFRSRSGRSCGVQAFRSLTPAR